LGTITSDAVVTVVSVAVVAVVVPEYWRTNQYSTKRYWTLENGPTEALVRVYFVAVAEATTLVALFQYLKRKVHVPSEFVVQDQTLVQMLPTGVPVMEPAATVRSKVQVPATTVAPASGETVVSHA
jgi:hypothetical protein